MLEISWVGLWEKYCDAAHMQGFEIYYLMDQTGKISDMQIVNL